MPINFISSHACSTDSTKDITAGFTADYSEYLFYFVNMHPDTDNAHFQFQVNCASGNTSGFNNPITSSVVNIYNGASKSATGPNYETSNDQASGTGSPVYQDILSRRTGNQDKETVCGWLRLFEPTNTTHTTMFMSEGIGYHMENYALAMYVGGYIDSEEAIDEISFKFNTGNIESGTIYMYGVS